MGEFAPRALVASAIFLGLAVLLLGAYTLRIVLVAVFLAITLAAAIRPLALGMQRDLRVGFGTAVLLVYLMLLLVAATLATLVVPLFLSDLLAFVNALPGYAGQVGQWLSDLSRLTSGEGAPPGAAGQVQALTGVGLSALAGLLTVPLGVVAVVAWVITVLVLAFYWLLERDVVLWRVGALTPPTHRRQVYQTWVAVERKLGAYVLGQVIVSATIGTLTLVGLLILGVRYALVLAIFASITEIIPIVGPFIAAVPAVLIAFFQAPWLGLAVVALYFVIQQVEGNLVYPKIQERVSRVPAFWLLLALLAGAELMGILGALVAVPVAVTISAVLEELAPRVTSEEVGATEDGGGRRAA